MQGYRAAMRSSLFVAVLSLAACSKAKGDECQQVWDKMGPIMGKMGGGKAMPADAKDKFLKECRTDAKFKTDPVFACVLKASGEAAVADCMQKAFGDYMSKSKKTEAQLNLNKLGKNAKVFYVTEGSFPAGKAGPTPAGPCCDGPNHKCAAVPADQWAATEVWSKLDFQLDEPTLFTYSYEGDGKTVTATAVGDLDCDGTTITYKLEMTAGADGVPTMNIVEPPANAD
jgi:hypothetical protein